MMLSSRPTAPSPLPEAQLQQSEQRAELESLSPLCHLHTPHLRQHAASWVRVALQTFSRTASLPLLPAMALGSTVLLLLGVVGTGKGGVAEPAAVWGALQRGGQDWPVPGGCQAE